MSNNDCPNRMCQYDNLAHIQTTSNGCTEEEFAVYFLNQIKHETAKYTKETLPSANDGGNTPNATPTKSRPPPGAQQSTPCTPIVAWPQQRHNASHAPATIIAHRSSSTRPANAFHPDDYSTPQKRAPTTPIANDSSSRSFDRNLSRRSASNSFNLSDFMPGTPGSTTTPNAKRQTPNQRARRSTDNHQPSAQSPHTVASTTPQHIKPKRRVVPISLSAANSFSSLAFRTDNNLLGIGEDADHASVSASRDLLRTHKELIVRDFEQSSVESRQPLPIVVADDPPEPAVSIDLRLVRQRPLLQKMAAIYAALIDQQLTMNVLTEISYLLNLLNANYAKSHDDDGDDGEDGVTGSDAEAIVARLFRNAHNCVFFGVTVLSTQQHVLIVLDLATLTVLLQNERLLEFGDAALAERLRRVHAHRQQLHTAGSAAPTGTEAAVLNVSYQQDIDTRHNFPTTREFGAFNKQRDQFYAILRVWQSSHYIPSWSCAAELGGKVLALLRCNDHPVNMHHLAKLYVSQLLLSCTFDDAGHDLHALLPNTDAGKLSKLQQRLHAPSHFSTDYTFPGQQAFFKEFLQLAEYHHVFVEHLRIVLIAELLELNDSTYETLNVSADDARTADPPATAASLEYAVRSETIVKMRVLAKFIGLLTARPHEYDGARCADVDQRLALQRNQIRPDFDVRSILIRSVLGRRVLIVVPWLVQYVSMLDAVTVRLAYFADVLELLCELHIMCSDGRLPVSRTSRFIVQSCVGWLFDQANVPHGYLQYRRSRRQAAFADSLARHAGRMRAVRVLVPVEMWPDVTDYSLAVCASEDADVGAVAGTPDKMLSGPTNPLVCTMRRIADRQTVEAHAAAAPLHPDTVEASLSAAEPMEDILTAACPFLADFRVSIMPPKLSKTISRSGRYRHITTKTAELTAAKPPTPSTVVVAASPAVTTNAAAAPQTAQARLAEAFLHSQSLSVRRTVDFCVERTVSAVIKDFQIEHIVRLKAETVAALLAGKMAPTDLADARRRLEVAYSDALCRLRELWALHGPVAIGDRAERALDALLPRETVGAVRQVCVTMVKQRCAAKTGEWVTANFASIDLFTKDPLDDADKLLKGTLGRAQPAGAAPIVIASEQYSPALHFGQLQSDLYTAAVRPHELTVVRLTDVLRALRNCITVHTLPESMTRNAAFMSLQLMLLCVARRSDLLLSDEAVLDAALRLWQCDRLHGCTRPPLVDEPEDLDEAVAITSRQLPTSASAVAAPTNGGQTYVFGNVVSVATMRQICAGSTADGERAAAMEALERLLRRLLGAGLLTLHELNEQTVRLFRWSWPDERFLGEMSAMLERIGDDGTARRAPAEAQMFLGMLADLTRDMECL